MTCEMLMQELLMSHIFFKHLISEYMIYRNIHLFWKETYFCKIWMMFLANKCVWMRKYPYLHNLQEDFCCNHKVSTGISQIYCNQSNYRECRTKHFIYFTGRVFLIHCSCLGISGLDYIFSNDRAVRYTAFGWGIELTIIMSRNSGTNALNA